jgi:hypothetical protein
VPYATTTQPNLPVGLIGIGFALALIGRERAAPQRFDLVCFLLCGGACIALTYGLELLGRPQPPSMGIDDRTTDREAHAYAVGLGRVSRLRESFLFSPAVRWP